MEMKTDKLKTKEIVFCAFKNPVIYKNTESDFPTPIPIPVPQPVVDSQTPTQETPQTNNTQLNGNKILNSLDDQKAIMKYQNLLIESSDEEIKLIVNDLKGKYRELILDKNGNFFCKDLFKTCDRNERIEILKELSPTLSVDCRDNYATHPLQALIEYSSSSEEYELILSSFIENNNILSASINKNGAYVIQKISARIPQRFRNKFNAIFISFFLDISKEKYGIVSAKKFIENTKGKTITQNIMNIIRNNFFDLAKDKFGNYLIPFLLEKWNNYPEVEEIKNLIIKNKDFLSNAKIPTETSHVFKKIWENNKSETINSNKLNEQLEGNNQLMNLLKINEDNVVSP